MIYLDRIQQKESLGMNEATLKDLALGFLLSREVEDRGVCLSPFRGELRTRREERNTNGAKNLLGARISPKILL